MAERRSALVVGILLAAIVAAGIALLVLTKLGRGFRPSIAMVVGPLALMVVVAGIVFFVRLRRRGRTQTPAGEKTAARLGLTYRKSPPSDGFHRKFGPLPGIPRGGSVRHVLTGSLAGRALTIFQHSYVIHTGQAPVPVYHTVYITNAPDWPGLTVAPRQLVGRLLYRLGRRPEVLLENESFNALRKVKADDPDFALTILHPDMQTFLIEKSSTTWRIHAGCVALIYGGPLKFDRMDASLDRLRTFWALVPQELDAW